jgi:hypothetical protein
MVLGALTLCVLVPLCSMRSMSGLTTLNAIGLASLGVFAALTVSLAALALQHGTAHTLPFGPDWPALGSDLPSQLTGGRRAGGGGGTGLRGKAGGANRTCAALCQTTRGTLALAGFLTIVPILLTAASSHQVRQSTGLPPGQSSAPGGPTCRQPVPNAMPAHRVRPSQSVHPLRSMLQPYRLATMDAVFTTTLTMVTAFFITVSVAAYAAFGSALDGNYLNNLSTRQLTPMIGPTAAMAASLVIKAGAIGVRGAGGLSYLPGAPSPTWKQAAAHTRLRKAHTARRPARAPGPRPAGYTVSLTASICLIMYPLRASFLVSPPRASAGPLPRSVQPHAQSTGTRLMPAHAPVLGRQAAARDPAALPPRPLRRRRCGSV